MGTLQSLLAEMSGLKKPRGFFNRIIRRALGMRPKPPPKYRILHIFATNRPDVLDEAMLRPGRIDRIYKVGYPSKEGRKATYEYYLAKVKHQLTPQQVDRLATVTPYATGASIQDMVNEALVIAIRDGREVITWRDINNAKQLKQHGLPDDFKYVERERHAIAVHEACHAVAAYRVQRHLVIDVATIERRGDIGGFVAPIPLEDIMFEWKSEQEADIMVSLASLAGERMFFDDDNSTGVGADLHNATALMIRMEAYLGMGSTVGSHSVTKVSAWGARGFVAEDGTDRNLFETALGKRVEEQLQAVYERTRALLKNNRQHVLNVAHALESDKTVSGDDIVAIIEGRPGPLIDGTRYHDPGFRAEIEAYHGAAAAAHKEHAKVDSPLPVLVPVTADGDGRVDGEVPSRPDLTGNGEVREALPVGEPDGSHPVQAEAAVDDAARPKERRRKKES